MSNVSALRRLFAPADVVAPRLLGALLSHHTAAGSVTVRLTEVEAYLGCSDPGSHAFRGLTPRTAPMFGPAGHLYVYFTYGMHWCANVVTGLAGEASACLLRAGEVVAGEDLARSRRPAARSKQDLARGPARLASALGLDGSMTGQAIAVGFRNSTLDEVGVTLRLRARSLPNSQIGVGPRVGVSGPGGDGERFPFRYWLKGDSTVSPYRAAS